MWENGGPEEFCFPASPLKSHQALKAERERERENQRFGGILKSIRGGFPLKTPSNEGDVEDGGFCWTQ